MNKKDQLNSKSFVKEKDSENYVYLQLLQYLYSKGFLDNYSRLKEDSFKMIGQDPKYNNLPAQVKVDECYLDL